ncbi:unnamed protein product [Angiostrongylus costaricensis]|uniref:AAA domain-containing protein n=1 Tax=Angiostrongylus costaricensis TaxID=334426 RepID=A0A0R3Q2I8_ANGCS|nr:unnamed protein product [Angiostrongylus costaricensis]
MAVSTGQAVASPADEEKARELAKYRKKLVEYRDIEQQLKLLRKKEGELQKALEKSENDIKSLHSVGQIVGEVLKQLAEEKFIVKTTNGPRYVVGCRRSINKEQLKPGTRVALDVTTLTIMRQLPREVDPLVYKMSHEDPGNVTYADVGGLDEQIRQLREVIELPLKNPELFRRVGITPPKGYKYIGESARMIREMFNYAHDHQPCIVFMDEVDAIGGRRFSEGTSADREIQRTLLELLSQLDGFDSLGRIKVLKIHANPITKSGDINYDAVVKLSDGFSCADLRNVCTEAGLFAIRAEREYVIEEDFMKAVRKVGDAKRLETKLDYRPV